MFSDAAVTFTLPASPTAACPSLEAVAENTPTPSDPILTPIAAASRGDLVYALAVGGDSLNFEIDETTGVVTVKNTVELDYETKKLYTLIIT